VSKQNDISSSEIKQKIFRYCAYQERCHLEVRNKLYEWGVSKTAGDEIISDLITQGFLNEERFARAYTGGKFRTKSWGRMKITHALESKGLTPNCIRSGMQEIDEKEYLKTLKELILKKTEQIIGENPYVKNDRVAKYVIQKGFEPELVWKVIKEQNQR
jgi:regulatory protein